MSHFRRYYGYRRYRKNDKGVEFFGGLLLLFGTLVYYFIKGIVAFINWVWKLVSQKRINTDEGLKYGYSREKIPLWAKSGDLHQEHESSPSPSYFKKHSLLTPAEKRFHEVLEKIALENNYIIQSKVRLEALVGVHFYTENWWGLRNRIKSREMDFVLCEKQEFNAILVIELDDSSHQRWDRMERDENIDRILDQAGLPILHIKTSSSYNMEYLANQIKEKVLTTK